MASQTAPAQLIATASEQGRWRLDPARSSAGISNKSVWGLITVTGGFADVTGEGQVDADGTGSGVVTVRAASIDTKHEKRDAHLRSKDFFDVERHESIVFTAHRAVARTGDEVEVTGELTVRGVAKPLGFTARVVEQHAGAIALKAEIVLKRTDFGMTWNMLGMLKPLTTLTVTACFVPA